VGRKWIMMTGMLLAVVTYRPLFGRLLAISDEKTKTELSDKKEIKTTRKIIGENPDTLRTTAVKQFYDDGLIMINTTTDTLYAGHTKSTIKPDVKVSKNISSGGYWQMVLIVFVMIIYVTMVYGPIAAFLVELFPTRIRYTSMSLPYHIGNGVFGGLTPFIATLLTTIYTGDKLVGLYYPLLIAGLCLIIGAIYVNNKIDPNVND